MVSNKWNLLIKREFDGTLIVTRVEGLTERESIDRRVAETCLAGKLLSIDVTPYIRDEHGDPVREQDVFQTLRRSFTNELQSKVA